MFVRAFIVAAVALFVVVAPASAGEDGTIVFRVTQTPQFLPGTARCPVLRLDDLAQSLDGAVIGSFEFCLVTFSQDPSGALTGTGTVTFSFPAGTIEATLNLVEMPTGPHDVQFDSGTITGGTGAYANASGQWRATGTITYSVDGTPHPNLVYVISLHR